MRLAYLVSAYPTANHTYILREVRALRALGIEVDVVAISGDDRPLDALTVAEREERARTFVVKRAGAGAIAGAHLATLLRTPLRYLRGVGAALRLGRLEARATASYLLYFAEAIVVGHWLRERDHRWFHVHYAPAVGLLVTRVFDVDMSATIHGSAEFIDPVAQRLSEKVAAARFVCAISAYGRSQLMRATPAAMWDRIELTPLGIDPADFVPRPAPVRRAGDPFTVVCVGQLQPAKGQHVLVSAIARLVARGVDARLQLAGDGPDRAALERHAVDAGVADRVAFLGRLNQDEVRALYREADAFALASFAEGLPVVLMEAMAIGVPCVATRITGIPELVRDEVDGLLVTPSEVDALADALERLATDPSLAARLVASAHARVRERYDLTRNVEQLAAVFRARGALGPATR